MDVYGSPIRSPNEPQVVPDDGYNSPIHSPYYGMDSVRSPADSDTSTVDSAFDELAEVIPELNKPKKIGYEESYRLDSLEYSPDMYEVASPETYDSDYDVFSPSDDLLMQAIDNASRKRSFSPCQTATNEWDGYSHEKPPNKQVKTESNTSAAYLTSLYVQHLANEYSKRLLTPLNEDSGIDVNSYGTATSVPSTTQSFVDPLGSQSCLVDDKTLMRGFSVLAQYVTCESSQEESQQVQPKSMPHDQVNVKVEEPDVVLSNTNTDVKEENQDVKYQPGGDCSPLMPSQWVASMLPSKVQSISYSQASQSSPQSESWGNSFSTDKQQASYQASVAELCKKAVGASSSVVFFNIAKEKKEVVKPVKETQPSREIAAPIDPKEMVRNWKGAIKTKRPNLISHSSKPRLYNFLLELLNDCNSRCIEWLDEEQGIFKFMNSNEVAKLWGQRKNKPNMKYENFARSLRTYVAKGILTKPRNKLVYQFMPNYH